jgi:Flp pilus assembly protein TadB
VLLLLLLRLPRRRRKHRRERCVSCLRASPRRSARSSSSRSWKCCAGSARVLLARVLVVLGLVLLLVLVLLLLLLLLMLLLLLILLLLLLLLLQQLLPHLLIRRQSPRSHGGQSTAARTSRTRHRTSRFRIQRNASLIRCHSSESARACPPEGRERADREPNAHHRAQARRRDGPGLESGGERAENKKAHVGQRLAQRHAAAVRPQVTKQQVGSVREDARGLAVLLGQLQLRGRAGPAGEEDDHVGREHAQVAARAAQRALPPSGGQVRAHRRVHKLIRVAAPSHLLWPVRSRAAQHANRAAADGERGACRRARRRERRLREGDAPLAEAEARRGTRHDAGAAAGEQVPAAVGDPLAEGLGEVGVPALGGAEDGNDGQSTDALQEEVLRVLPLLVPVLVELLWLWLLLPLLLPLLLLPLLLLPLLLLPLLLLPLLLLPLLLLPLLLLLESGSPVAAPAIRT